MRFWFIFTLFLGSGSLLFGSGARVEIDGRLSVMTEVVSTPEKQRLGLGFRESLIEGHGMLFLYDEPQEAIFWMKNMRFAIDIIWILRGQILHIEENVPPPSIMLGNKIPTYGHGLQADMVLEVPAGFSTRHVIQQGSQIRYFPK